MMRFFPVTPPSVHQMVLSLEKAGLISRKPGVPRSIAVLLERSGRARTKSAGRSTSENHCDEVLGGLLNGLDGRRRESIGDSLSTCGGQPHRSGGDGHANPCLCRRCATDLYLLQVTTKHVTKRKWLWWSKLYRAGNSVIGCPSSLIPSRVFFVRSKGEEEAVVRVSSLPLCNGLRELGIEACTIHPKDGCLSFAPLIVLRFITMTARQLSQYGMRCQQSQP